MDNAPVLIAGGGPVGVVTALALAERGCSGARVRPEAEARVNQTPRASGPPASRDARNARSARPARRTIRGARRHGTHVPGSGIGRRAVWRRGVRPTQSCATTRPIRSPRSSGRQHGLARTNCRAMEVHLLHASAVRAHAGRRYHGRAVSATVHRVAIRVGASNIDVRFASRSVRRCSSAFSSCSRR